ncbi:MAG: caspase family protein [Chitinophagaceae bacterium]|nr:caspase family protein [Chitinophagaceae bacterium]
MKQKALPAIILFLALYASVTAQSVYKLQYTVAGQSSRLVYDGLFVRFDDGSAVLRVKYNLPGDTAARLADIKMQEDYPRKSNGGEDPSAVFYTGKKASFIRSKPDPAFVLPVIWFKADTQQNILVPYGVTRQKVKLKDVKPTFTESELMDTGTLKKTLVLQYYTPDEDFYKGFYESRSRSLLLTAEEKKIRIHLLLVGNTLEEEIGSSCEKDMNLADSTFSGLASDLGLEIIKKRITGTDFGKKNFDALIDGVNPASRDIVIFYYSGHGFRKKEDNRRFPFLDLRSAPADDYNVLSVNMRDIFDRIKSKGARLNLIISDCCNTFPEVTNRIAEMTPETPSSKGLGWNGENCRKLFLSPQRQSILCTAADAGQRATSNNRFGGFFTFHFRKAMDKNMGVMNRAVSWTQILDDTKMMTGRKAERTYCDKKVRTFFTVCLQYPYYVIE